MSEFEGISYSDFRPTDNDFLRQLKDKLPEHSEEEFKLRRFPASLKPGKLETPEELMEEARIIKLEDEIDKDLEGPYQEAEHVEVWTPAEVTAFMRAAWGHGFKYGRQDDGSFARKHGFRDPGSQT